MENLFRQEVTEHRRAKLDGNVSLIQPTSFKYLTFLLVAITVSSLIFLSLGKYSRKEQVTGTLLPDKGIVKIRAQQTGVISELFVTEHQTVKAGEALIKIKSEKFGESGFEANESLIQQYQFQIDSLTKQVSKKKEQSKLQQEDLNNSLRNLNQELEQITSTQALLNKRININNEIKSQIRELSQTGYASELEFKRQNDSILLLEQQRLGLETDSLATVREIAQTKNRLKTSAIEHGLEIANLEEQLNETKLNLSRAKQQKVTEIVSPIDGVVTGILAEQGSLTDLQNSLLSIVPANSELIAQLFVPTSAIGFVEEGQKVKLRYRAFPYEKFGIYQGEIIEASKTVILPSESNDASALNLPSYRVKVRLESQFVTAYGKQFALRPDMQIDADIIIEQRSLLRWLFDPIFSLKG